MTEQPERREPTIRPASATLRYRTTGKIDPLDLARIIDEVHTLICGNLPGTHIASIVTNNLDLTITVEDASR